VQGHYEQRLEQDLLAIGKQVAHVGDEVERAVADAARAVLAVDRALACDTILGDLRINRGTNELDRLCHGFVARHVPSAGHLRYVSSVLRLSIMLERIGDYAATISRTALQLGSEPPAAVRHDIEMMADQARRLLHSALKAFEDRNPQTARDTIASARQLTSTYDRVFADLVREGEAGTRPVPELFAFLATFNRLERVIHQAKNVCEQTIFVATGETKPAKTFDILFVDARNDGASLLAEHYARKAYPGSGTFASAGWQPAARVDPAYVAYAGASGLDLSEAWPRPLASILGHLTAYEIVIVLAADARKHLPKIPFHTVLLEWDLTGAATPEAVFKELVPRISELMEKLRGEEA
jgi:phosphate transport system protein